MTTKMLSLIVGVVVVLGVSTAARAENPIQMQCPAGSVQKLVAGQDLHCVNKDGTRPLSPMVMLYPSGKKMAEGQVAAGGFRSGTWTLFDEKGVKTHTIEFKGGNFDGKWVEFYPNGVIKKTEQFKDGISLGVAQSFDLTGKPVPHVVAK
ncbi:MAG: toxin-antitoxin system YwqK family antitoxin [Myxococcaceae bacterium]